jgi:DNA-binding protein HU-beta
LTFPYLGDNPHLTGQFGGHPAGSSAPRFQRFTAMEGIVNKAELIENVAKKTDLTKKDAGLAVDATLDAIKRGTKKGGVSLAGFGSFNVSSRKARMGRNPQTGEEIKIKASKSVRFRPGKDYKGML